jgi:hypothetical protein
MDIPPPMQPEEHNRTQKLDPLLSIVGMSNTCYAPIDRLPRELLARIFSLCLPDSWIPGSGDFVRFLGISYVCSLWRAIMLETPSLWAVLPCETTLQSVEALRRARHAPLDVSLNIRNIHKDTSQLTMKLLDMSRIRSLEIDCFLGQFASLVGALNHGAPMLSTLSIQIQDSYFLLYSGQDLHLCAGRTPQLMHLRLTRCTELFLHIETRSLHTLHLVRGGQTMDPIQLVNMLKDIPELHDLKLFNFFLPRVPFGHPSAPALLPRLHKLVVHELEAPCFRFVQDIQCPALTIMEIDFLNIQRTEFASVHQVTLFTDFLSRWNERLQDVTIGHRREEHYFLAEPVYRYNLAFPEPCHLSSAYCRIGLWTRDHRRSPQKSFILLQLATHLKIERIDLSFLMESPLEADMLVGFLCKSSRTMRELEASESSACGVVRALGLRLDADSALDSDHYFLSKLEKLILSDVDFGITIDGATLWSLFAQSLKGRANSGLRELEICIHGSTGVTREEVGNVKAAGWVREFEWIGSDGDSDNNISV